MKYAFVHISDIHYRKEEPEGVSTVLKSFIQDLTKQKKIFSDYTFYIAITGDIVFAGKDSVAYEQFSAELDHELNNLGLKKEFRLMVPGNHDIDQVILKNNLDDFINTTKQNIDTEQSFNNFICKENILTQKFENYELFESDFVKYGIYYSTVGHGWEIDNYLGVYCLNTALTSFGGVEEINDEKKLAICTRELTEWCNKKKTPLNILLMHHPINHLNDWSKDEIKSIIENNFSLCLSGHNHEKDVFYNKISQNTLICSSPQLFTKKNDSLGYAIVLIKENNIDKIIYRQYVKGCFLNGSIFAENDEGIVDIQNNYFRVKVIKNMEILELKLRNALESFKNQPEIFVEPKISKSREFNNEENMLYEIIKEPQSTIITAQPQFGLSSLAHYLRKEAYKLNSFWIYLDANQIKARSVAKEIDEQLHVFDKNNNEINCIIVDSWNESFTDHQNIVKFIDSKYENIPIIILTSYIGFAYKQNFSFSKLKHNFITLHLQALQRDKIRELVSNYNKIKNIANEDEIVSKVVNDLEALNIHRTPLNCFTLLKVFEKNFNESMINRTKMIKAVLFILFTDIESFIYSSKKPDVDDVEYLLGDFCKTLIQKHTTKFMLTELKASMKRCAENKLISVDIETIINILLSNNILLSFYENELEFKHCYWIYYFAGTYMAKDDEFRDYILRDRNYVNYPEIIEFYTGWDGQREYAVQTLLKETTELTNIVNSRIGISEEFNPFNEIIWNPSAEAIEEIRKEISLKVKNSNLPSNIKDQHADATYNSEAPYDQSINNFLQEYSVVSLLQSIRASSRALRNSNYINPELKFEMLQAIVDGWEQFSRVIFWLSPALAEIGHVSYDGLGLILSKEFKGTFSEKLKNIYLANPLNVVNILKDDISSNKIGPVFYKNLGNNTSVLQKHFISLFLIKERPDGWYEHIFDYMNLLHVNSYYIKDLYDTATNAIKDGFLSNLELNNLKNLQLILNAKLAYAPKRKIKAIPKNMILNTKNELPIDKILASSKTDTFKN